MFVIRSRPVWPCVIVSGVACSCVAPLMVHTYGAMLPARATSWVLSGSIAGSAAVSLTCSAVTCSG